MDYEVMIDDKRARWVVGYEGLYRVTEIGDVVSYATSNPKILKSTPNERGYYRVTLTKDRKGIKHKVHRLVAQAFILNTKNSCSVDHRDENKSNNSVSNLRWCNIQENLEFYWDSPDRVHKEPKQPERVYGTTEDMVKATGKSIVVSGQEFPSCGSAAQWIVEQEELEERTRNKATISKELRRFLQGKKPAWTMYERYTIGT